MIGKFYKIILDIIRSIDLLTEIIWKIKIKKKITANYLRLNQPSNQKDS